MASKISASVPRVKTPSTTTVSKPAKPKPSTVKPSGVKDTVKLSDSAKRGGFEASSSIAALSKGLAANFGSAVVDPSTEANATGAVAEPKDPGAEKGQAAVDLARKFEGMYSQDVKGKMGPFQAAGGKSKNCADFVSSALQATGHDVQRDATVSGLRSQLLEKGWQAIPQDQARPGDVWMTESNKHGSRHTELVSKPGGTHTIGSNNIRKGQQQITERAKTGGIFYGHRPSKPGQ